MKRLIITTINVFSALLVGGQTISIVANQDIPLKESTSFNVPKPNNKGEVNLLFKINNIPKGEEVTLDVSDVSEAGKESATLNTDYKYINGTLPFSKTFTYNSPNFFSVDMQVLTDRKRDAVISIVSNGKEKKTFKLKLKFNTGEDLTSSSPKLNIPDTGRWDVRIITGGNFDFFNGPKIKDFAGEINVSIPSIFAIKKMKEHPFGIQFSIFKYHYYQADSSSFLNNSDNYYLNPKDAYSSPDSAKVVHRSFSINRKVDYSIWGAFIEPVMKIAENDFAQFYVSAHLEALITTITYSPTIKYLAYDTINYNRKVPTKIVINSILPHPAVPYTYRQSTFYDFYYGIGLPLKINYKNKLMFNITQTLGAATIQTSTPADPFDYVQRYGNGQRSEQKGFYLAKYQIITTVAPVDIAFGGEYRTVFGNMHYFTNYIGASITLDKLKR
ncbi:hypothetical protein [Mucilaginibacter lappiensis]|uniref:hypothetical protein n=1 Tax=Mucilaginibacter lappiensis TaxID=354630 RepID=UPI003D2185C9